MSPRAADFRELPREQDHLTRHTRTWHAEGEPETHNGRTIDVHRRVGGAPLLLFLHGFPTSSFDWRFLLVQDRTHAAVSFDYPGLGCSQKPADGDYSLVEVADLAEVLVREHGQDRSVLVVAHDLGVSAAAELIARDLDGTLTMDLAGAVFLNGAVVPGEAARQFGEKLLAGGLRGLMGGERRFRHEFGRVFSPAHTLSHEEAEDQWSLLSYRDGHKLGKRLLSYLDDGAVHAERWRAAIRNWPKPIRAVWGMCDPVAGPAELQALRALQPAVDVTELADVGHFPQIESPDPVYQVIKAGAAATLQRR